MCIPTYFSWSISKRIVKDSQHPQIMSTKSSGPMEFLRTLIFTDRSLQALYLFDVLFPQLAESYEAGIHPVTAIVNHRVIQKDERGVPIKLGGPLDIAYYGIHI